MEVNDELAFEIKPPDSLDDIITDSRGETNTVFFEGSTRKGSNALIRLNQTSSDIFSLAFECEFGQQVLEELVSDLPLFYICFHLINFTRRIYLIL